MEILLTVQIIVVVALIAVILVQRSDSDGFTGNSSPSSFMTGRAQANLFTRTTSILAAIFIINSLVLGYMAAHTERTSDIIESAVEEAQAEEDAAAEAAKEIENIEVPDEVEEKLEGAIKDKVEEIQKEIAPQVPAAE